MPKTISDHTYMFSNSFDCLYNKIEKAFDIAVGIVGKDFKRIINSDNSFHKFCLIKIIVELITSKWRQESNLLN